MPMRRWRETLRRPNRFCPSAVGRRPRYRLGCDAPLDWCEQDGNRSRRARRRRPFRSPSPPTHQLSKTDRPRQIDRIEAKLHDGAPLVPRAIGPSPVETYDVLLPSVHASVERNHDAVLFVEGDRALVPPVELRERVPRRAAPKVEPYEVDVSGIERVGRQEDVRIAPVRREPRRGQVPPVKTQTVADSRARARKAKPPEKIG